MSTEQILQRKRNAIIGAAVADAASLGFHWLYDQQRIGDLEPVAPEFRAHSLADYTDVPGYFAHAARANGDFSQYGEQMMVMLRSLVANNGSYSKSRYETAFVDCFGYGGSYIGYIDHPTRDTLNNIATAEAKALACAEEIPFDGDDALKHKLITKVLANVKRAATLQLTETELQNSVENAVRLTDNHDHLVVHALKILRQISSISGYHGTNDRQLPALSKLPPLLGAYADSDELEKIIRSAVRVTHDNDFSVDVAQAAAQMLDGTIMTGDIPASLSAAKANSSPEIALFFTMAEDEINQTTPAATAKWGMACELKLGMPGIIHNLSVTNSYTDAIRQNIYSGGDSCGRSILIGAIAGAYYGVGGDMGIPQPWIDRLNSEKSLLALVDSLTVRADQAIVC